MPSLACHHLLDLLSHIVIALLLHQDVKLTWLGAPVDRASGRVDEGSALFIDCLAKLVRSECLVVRNRSLEISVLIILVHTD